jgi:predicted ATP-binding protein involved in virulence
MHLQRVQVPNFRVLKNIDITFEKERIPKIFPLASLNGGGKSTLLQLIFTLLTSCADEDKHEFLRNILKDFEIDDESGYTELATIEIIDDDDSAVKIIDNSVILEFFCHKSFSLIDKLSSDQENDILKKLGFSECLILSQKTKNEIDAINKEIAVIKHQKAQEEIRRLTESPLSQALEKYNTDLSRSLKISNHVFTDSGFGRPAKDIEIQLIDNKLNQLLTDRNTIETQHNEINLAIAARTKILNMLQAENTQYIVSYKDDVEHNESMLLCHITGGKDGKLEAISQKVFLAAPQGQVFLFFSREDIDSLFSLPNSKKESNESIIQRNNTKLTNFFLYDFAIINILADAFEKAFENDKRQAKKTRGEYGDEYSKLCKDMENVFTGKTIEPSEDSSQIIVKLLVNNEEVIMHPEDLSHGELRRLSFYIWLRTKAIKDSIVLVDEIEVGLHPDWQYQIVRDLEDWAPSNQYILATHSYEICSALTPAHVKEIEPKLTKSFN